jgi:FkbM family methyltransferase
MSERKIREWAFPHINKFRIYIDVGASNGDTAFPFINEFQKIIAFEPNPTSYSELSSNSMINSYNIALGNFNGETALTIPINGSPEWGSVSKDRIATWGEFTSMMVPIKKLDDFDLEDVDFIKIDVEQGEYDVIMGAMETLKRCMPVIMFENKRNENDEVIRILTELGYSIQKYKSDTIAYWKKQS